MSRAERRAEKARQRKRLKNGRPYVITLDSTASMPIECQVIKGVQAMPDNATDLRIDGADDDTEERAWAVVRLMHRMADGDDDARAELEAIGQRLRAQGFDTWMF